MQTVSDRFNELSQGAVRPLTWGLRISFDKTFDPLIGFFTLSDDSTPMSLLDGPDLLAPSDDSEITPSDKYFYTDFTSRVQQLEWTVEEDSPFSVHQAIADVFLDNHDGLFTRGASPLDPYLLPRRPIRILAGFDNEAIPQFVGITERTPEYNKSSGIASLHAMDFLSFIFNKPLDETVILENVTTDEILDYLFQLVGLSPSNYVLDPGFNQVSFLYFEKGTKLGSAVREIMQPELGSLYLDELGIIRFKNRVRATGDPVMYFNSTNIIDYTQSDEDEVINVVEIKANIRKVQPEQPIYNISEPIQVLAGMTQEKFFNLEDPITSLGAITNYLANSQEDGEGADLTSDIQINDVDVFATTVKVTFENIGLNNAYITELELVGTPAKVIGEPLYVRLEDEDSVDQFEERVMTIENDFIQSTDAANSLGLSILNYFKDYSNVIELEVKGNLALQLGDTIHIDIDNVEQEYTLTKIVNLLQKSGDQERFIQRLTGKVFNVADFFKLSSDDIAMSLLDGSDVLAP